MKIAIIGMMGSGKTEIGHILSAKMGLDCIDLDEFIEKSVQMKVSDIFESWGESRFRGIETNALMELSASTRSFVLCCGGGVVLSEYNRNLLLHRFLSVWLDVPREELERRLTDQRACRPLLRETQWKRKLETLYNERKDMYQTSAHIHYFWEDGQNAEDSASEIQRLIQHSTANPEALQG